MYPGFGVTEADLETLLTIFPHLFLVVPQDGYSAFRDRSGVWRPELNLLLELARAGRVVPVFRAPLYQYDPATVLPFLEDPELPVILPRQLDGLVVLTMARQFPFWRCFREDPQIAAKLYQEVRSAAADLEGIPAADEKLVKDFFRVLVDTVDMHIMVAERGEQWFADSGFAVAGNLTAGGKIWSLLNAYFEGEQKKALYEVAFEAHVYSTEMVFARTLGAVYAPALPVNEPILNMVASLQAGPRKVVLPPSTNELQSILKGLCIVRPEHVPLREYLEVINSAEAQRLQRIVTGLLNKAGGSPDQLRAEVERFNLEVTKWRKSPLHWVLEELDFLGLGLELAFLPTGVSVPGLTSIVGLVARALLKVDLRDMPVIGDLEDRVFGLIGGVSPAAVRISRIRRKIGGKY